MKAIRIRIYLLLCAALLLTTVARAYYLRHLASPPVIPSEPGIHMLLANRDSELDETRRMERIIDRFLSKWEITGASFALMKDGKLLYAKGFSIADKSSNEKVEVRHIFRIASLSKLITATGIMKLTETGELSLDDKVFGPQGILNDSAFLDIKDRRVEKITVEHLLRHQAGYSIRAGDPLFTMTEVARQLGKPLPLSLDDMVQYAASTRLRWEPGGTNNYSNLGYVVLGKVIEKVSGMPYETYIRDSILEPIGCRDMHIGFSDPARRFPNEVHYYEQADAEPVPCALGGQDSVPRSYGGCDLQVLSAAGGWVASPVELMKFITAIDPDNDQTNILNPASIKVMTARDEKQYPIGWARTTETNDWTRTGSLAGSSAMLKRQHDGYTWAFVTNTNSWSGSRFPRRIELMIREALGTVKEWPDRDLFEIKTANAISGASGAATGTTDSSSGASATTGATETDTSSGSSADSSSGASAEPQ